MDTNLDITLTEIVEGYFEGKDLAELIQSAEAVAVVDKLKRMR